MAKYDLILGHHNNRYRINTRWSQADVSRFPVNDCHEMVQVKDRDRHRGVVSFGDLELMFCQREKMTTVE